MTEQATTSQPAQGWYTDPHDAGQLRWWDGSSWTEHVHSANGNGDGAAEANGSVISAAAASKPAAGGAAKGAPASSAKSGGNRSAVSEWLSVRSNQLLLAVLIVALVLFAFVMLGGGA